MFRFCIYSLALFSLFTEIAHAQSTSPKRFYKKDYAVAPGAEGRDETEPSPGDSYNRGAGGHPQQSAPHDSHQRVASSGKKRRVVMSLHVNSADPEHFKNVLREVFTLVDEKFAFINSVNHIGDYRNVTPEMESELAKRNIALVAAADPPSSAQVTQSPTWIIRTQQGTHIAEGLIDIHSFFNEFGEYDPKRREDPNIESSVGRF